MTTSTSPARHVVILGAASRIAEETARLLATQGATLTLVGRDAVKLEPIAQDLKLRGAKAVEVAAIDLVAEEDPGARLGDMAEKMSGFDSLLVFHGTLGDQDKAQDDLSEAERILHTNYTSAVRWITPAVEMLEASDHPAPVVVAVSSVAGDRGRRSNYVYGSAKAGLSVFMQGLAHRLADGKKTRAVLMKLGFVKTAMTAHLNPSGPLWAEPEAVAKAIVKSMEKGGPIVYAPWFWRFVMLAIRVTPAFVFNKVNL